ncbi:hypothetical protein KYI09_11470 (plasmid) [Macrococcoides caseolyticum]|jgi:hypothetical protein|uniref:hypothetical protein n=1 Tax=Macrococcoides caseolyticum TaxID=69966 RepID=UPI001C5CE644|nr:hypothetical protein [Macrococcus caseolyticus]MDJ1110589.1 hypothetical protein [Macrococcus caseolyticus]QYA41227.1 hypothetical protein KYI09_11470 [Macrococcus caseolyticus]
MDDELKYKEFLFNVCKVDGINLRKIKYTEKHNIIIIGMKNHQKDGVDIECFKFINCVIKTLAPNGIKFKPQLYFIPKKDNDVLSRVELHIEESQIKKMNKILNDYK